MNVSANELYNKRFLNTDKIKTKKEIDKIKEELSTDQTFDAISFETQLNEARNLNKNGTLHLDPNGVYNIYYHYTIFN